MDKKDLLKLVQQGGKNPEIRKFRIFGDADFIIDLRFLSRSEVTAMQKRNQIMNCLLAKRGDEQLDEEGMRSDLCNTVIRGWKGLTPEVFRRIVYLDDEAYAIVSKEKEIPYSKEIAEMMMREGKANGVLFDMLILGIVTDPQNFSSGKLGDEVKNLPSSPDIGTTRKD
ncbi:MAG TPA: hypothetical protein PLG59_09865 [bacterium]|nr:hypothetical protein [bacterium]HQQ00046.1 hypothetical protein [bacterium]